MASPLWDLEILHSESLRFATVTYPATPEGWTAPRWKDPGTPEITNPRNLSFPALTGCIYCCHMRRIGFTTNTYVLLYLFFYLGAKSPLSVERGSSNIAVCTRTGSHHSIWTWICSKLRTESQSASVSPKSPAIHLWELRQSAKSSWTNGGTDAQPRSLSVTIPWFYSHHTELKSGTTPPRPLRDSQKNPKKT